jgi:DnaJ family protein A protein 2
VAEADRADADVKFKEISQAYEILYDDEKREMYDTHGMAAFDPSQGSGQPADMEEMLAQMFGMGGGMGGMGGGMGGRGARKPKRSPDEEQAYEVTLEDLYKGKTVKFASTKNVICSHCKGKGGKESAKSKQCSSCKGQGLASKYGYAVDLINNFQV